MSDPELRRVEFQEKQRRVLRFLAERQLDGVWLARRDNFAWYTGGGDSHVIEDYTHGEAGLLILREVSYLITNNIEAQRMIEEEVAGLPLEVIDYPWYQGQEQQALLESLAGERRIGSDTPMPDLGFEMLAGDFVTLRFVLTPAEQKRYRALCRESAGILEEVARSVEPGKTEREIGAEVFWRCHRAGITPVVVLVGADERLSRYRHPLPKGNPVHTYAMLVLVGVRGGLQTALTRLVAVNELPARIVGRHRAVTRVEAVYIHHTRPGHTLGQILEIGAAAYAAEGYPDEWHRHFQGGLIGYAPREIEAVPGLDTVVEPFQAAAWLPSITGTKSEDTFLILPDRNEMLTNTENWPMLQIEIERQTYYRPDILRL
jgi:Xaa-Pro dipeptidase